jgi:hypothetical protein
MGRSILPAPVLFSDLALAHVARAPSPAAFALTLEIDLELGSGFGFTQLIFQLALAFGWRSASALR